MTTTIIWTIAILTVLGAVLAVVLYIVAEKFKVEEDPRIDEVEKVLPGANCGGCGQAGCRAFAQFCVESSPNLDKCFCPVGGNDGMQKVAAVLGVEVAVKEPQVAVVRCNGTCENAPKKTHYEGADICAFAHTLFAGGSGCPNACLGLGDCVKKCAFDAIHVDPVKGIAVVDENKCVGCGTCTKACPRGIIEIRPKGKNNRRIYVSCVNIEKGAITMKNCTVGCIGCQKCLKECPFEAIEMRGTLAYINPDKCKQCRKCVDVCPRGSILAVNFPPRKPKVEVKEEVNNESKE